MKIMMPLMIPSKMGGYGGAMPIMMPLMEIMDPDGPGCGSGSAVLENSGESVYDKLDRGDIVRVMVRGYRPEGEIYRVLFFVSSVASPDQTKGIYGKYEEDLDEAPRFVNLSDIIVIELVAPRNSVANHVIRDLVFRRNGLKLKIAEHNDFVKKNILIGG